MSKEKKSVLRAILDDVYQSKTFDEAFAITEKLLTESKLHDNEKRVMILNAKGCVTLPRLQQYLTNSWLKYENLGVINRRDSY